MNRTKELKLILLNKTLSDRNCFSGANCLKDQGEKHLLCYHLHSVSYGTVLISVAKLHNALMKVTVPLEISVTWKAAVRFSFGPLQSAVTM